jgi:eukaryotic-like serine/threonine-protein kinase
VYLHLIMVPEPGLVIAAKYRLDRPLAVGGMGAIWVARHIELDVEVAVKLMTTELADDAVGMGRFRREAQAAARLRSPHVTQIHDYGSYRGRPYMVMELLEGEDLSDYLDRAGPLSLARAAEILVPVCRGLALAHRAGIVHRDIKPSNVFLAKSGDDELVKILDFGIAKKTVAETSIEGTASGVLIGTPCYMSPEQAQGLAVDHRSDIWALGVLLYEMLTNQLPFSGANLGQIVTAICTRPYLPPSTHLLLPAGVDELMKRLLEPDVERRIASAGAVVRALEAVVAGEPPPAEVPSSDATSAPIDTARGAKPRDADTAEQETIRADSGNEGRRDRTSPGVGLDSSAGVARTRRPLYALGGVALVGALAALYVVGSPEQQSAAPVASESAAAPSHAPPPPTASAAQPAPSHAAQPAPPPASSITASVAPSASASASQVAGPVPKRAMPPAPTPSSSVKRHSTFGIPE